MNFDANWSRLDYDPALCRRLKNFNNEVLKAITPRAERFRLSVSQPVCESRDQNSSRVWFPNGMIHYPDTIRMGLRDYGYKAPAFRHAIDETKAWERKRASQHDDVETKYQAVVEVFNDPLPVESISVTANSVLDLWVTQFMFRPLLFFGVGLFQEETGFWWLLAQRARNTYRVAPSARQKALIVLSSSDKKGSSSISGECMTDAKEEVFVIPKATSDPLNHLDRVVHAFENTGGQTVSSIRDQALHMNG